MLHSGLRCVCGPSGEGVLVGGGGLRGGGAQPPLLLHKIAYNVNACQLCDHQF